MKSERKQKLSAYFLPLFEILLCLVSANSAIFGMTSPIFIALLASSENLFIVGYIGVMIMYFISGALSANIFYIASATIVCGCRIIMMLDKRKVSKEFMGIITSVSMFVALCLVHIFYQLTASDTAMYIFSSLLCGAITYMLLLIKSRVHDRDFFGGRKLYYVSLSVLYVIIISSFASVELFGSNIGRILSVCVILSAAKAYRHIGGAVLGALSTCAIFVFSPQLSVNAMLLATSGLVAGLFSSAGTLVSALVFMICTVFSLAAGFINSDSFNMLTDSAIGCVIYSCLSDKNIEMVIRYLGINFKTVQSVGETASAGLRFASSTLADIRTQINEISDAVRKKFPQPDFAGENRIGLIESAKNDFLRQTVTDQLSTIENILTDMSARINSYSRVDAELSEKLRKAILKIGFKECSACVYIDETEKYCAQIYLPSKENPDLVALTMSVSKILSYDMDIPSVISCGMFNKLVFLQKPVYELRVGIWQSSKEDSRYCGDTVGIIPISASEEYIVLSDGMGTGKRAKLDSMFASGLVSKLVKAGISCSTSVGIINSVLRIKGWDESFATLDIARFDLYNGVCNFIKAGAASSFVLRDGVVDEICVESMPLGILREINYQDIRYKLFDGDIVILASDGAGEYAKRILSESGIQNISSSEKIAGILGSRFSEVIPENRRDDMSVVVIKVLCTSI